MLVRVPYGLGQKRAFRVCVELDWPKQDGTRQASRNRPDLAGDGTSAKISMIRVAPSSVDDQPKRSEGTVDVEPRDLVDEELDASESLDRCSDELALVIDEDLDPSNYESTRT